MPNAAAHKVGAGIAVTALFATHQIIKNREIDWTTLATSFAGSQLGTLPDLLEPATHPNHRAFFHSYTVLAAVGYAGYKLYKWEPETSFERLLKDIGIVASIAYATHLLMDSKTPKGLPLV